MHTPQTANKPDLRCMLATNHVDAKGVHSVGLAKSHLRCALSELESATTRMRSAGKEMSDYEGRCKGVLQSLLGQALLEIVGPSCEAVMALEALEECIRDAVDQANEALPELGEGTWLKQTLQPMGGMPRAALEKVKRARKAVSDKQI